jgi:hypothetical protein
MRSTAGLLDATLPLDLPIISGSGESLLKLKYKPLLAQE